MAERDRVLQELKRYFLQAQQMMKKQDDLHRREVEFIIGDLVYFKLNSYL